ncbi:hypothetical protein D3871_08750 [Noviherbaspirillum saxi]|uniref:Uncharacterized protein n=1 Tax=Noviherbaspirillum saxi TaxID=2320863 RepID=A0A3A3FQU7_9BURK|nr:hypothetical protein D3871_08750 [Noviherbaspirillum saxi]
MNASTRTPTVDANARTALVTAIGIILGFALAFFYTWSLKDPPANASQVQSRETNSPSSKATDLHPTKAVDPDQPWEPEDIPALIALCSGIIVLMFSLFRSLWPLVQSELYYRNTVLVFMLGIVITFGSSIYAVFV